jgi:hypothetical protein
VLEIPGGKLSSRHYYRISTAWSILSFAITVEHWPGRKRAVTEVISTPLCLLLPLRQQNHGFGSGPQPYWGVFMATAATAYGERRFGAAYTLKLLVALGVLGFLVGMWATQDDPRTASHPTLVWVSVAVVLAGVGLWVVIGKSALIISDSGVRRESLFGQQEMAWSQVAETRYQVVPVNVYMHFGLVGALIAMSSKKSSRAQLTLELVSREQKKLKVTSNYRNAEEAIGIILGRLMPPMVQNVKNRLQRGETVHFGGLGLSATAVIWKGTSIPVGEITKAELAGASLQIKRQGKWLSAVSVRSNKVPDVLVFLEVLESLAPQIKSAVVDPLARVRL